jgi:hypothetical protein
MVTAVNWLFFWIGKQQRMQLYLHLLGFLDCNCFQFNQQLLRTDERMVLLFHVSYLSSQCLASFQFQFQRWNFSTTRQLLFCFLNLRLQSSYKYLLLTRESTDLPLFCKEENRRSFTSASKVNLFYRYLPMVLVLKVSMRNKCV